MDFFLGDLSFKEGLSILLTATSLYLLVIAYVRVLGTRSISDFNNFDWIVTVSIGAIMGKTIMSRETSIVEGGLAILIMFLLQVLVTKVLFSFKMMRPVVRTYPRLLLFEGKVLEENCRKERIIKPELYAAVRNEGIASLEEVYAVVLESNASLSVIAKKDVSTSTSAMQNVNGT